MSRNTGKVLILSPHVMTAALVGWYVELAKLEPAFADPGENAADALARVKPLLVVLIDSANEEAINDLFAARASRREVGLAIFSGSRDDDAARADPGGGGLVFGQGGSPRGGAGARALASGGCQELGGNP